MSPERVNRAAIRPNMIAAVIPPAALVSPPVSIPNAPSVFTASFMPSHITNPNPLIGTVAPAPANSVRGLYSPTAPKITPATANPVRILAGGSFF